MKTTAHRVAELNDLLRGSIGTALFGHIVPSRLLVTCGISNLPAQDQALILANVRDFEAFTPDNDPHREHDFGAFDFKGMRIFWKIDYYDPSLKYGSEDPADTTQTVRVLTVMLAEE